MPNKKLAIRLKAARESLGLTLTEAADRLGFSNYQVLSNIENGEREVKVSELSKFAKVYFLSISSLLDQENNAAAYSLLWRNPPVELQKKEIEAKILYLSKQYHLFEKLLNIKARHGFLDITKEDIRTNHEINILAKKISELLGLGKRPAFSLQKVLEQDYGIKILFFSLSSVGSAASMLHPEIGSIIVVNADEAPWRRNYDLAHELFHLVTWKSIPQEELSDTSYFQEIEKKAEKFASILLLPENEVRNSIIERFEAQNNEFTDSDLIDVAREFGVSTKALLYRMANLRFIKWEYADELANNEEILELNKKMRQDEWGKKPESEHFYSLAIRCLRKGLISRGKFAEIIEIERSDIDDFIEKQGLRETEGKPIELMAS